MRHNKHQTTLAILYLALFAAFALAMSATRAAMDGRIGQCWATVEAWRNEAYSMVAGRAVGR